ncbi:MAG: acetate/propionate family kinase [Candidatus Eremiobacteraeota bacterium]|nr:acetate/propionate family kinase [Candidatus Eremiobacteraeota bacterium]
MLALCVDAGSSSCKFGVYRDDAEPVCVLNGELPSGDSQVDLLAAILNHLTPDILQNLGALGHRIVFGGLAYADPIVASEGVLSELEALVEIEPLHLRAELDVVYSVTRRFPQLPQVLCFDTAFHRAMPSIAKRLPLPESSDPLLQRYGFHGLSYEYILSRLGLGTGRTIVAHLGSGASLCAIRDGKPVDTTMGFSALGGLMMATRPGDLDPGVILRLLRTSARSHAALSDLLYHSCGLIGVSSSSADIRVLLDDAARNAKARDTVDLFLYQLLKHVGAMVAVLGGLDTLVFTGGIGEHQSLVRLQLCRRLAYLGCDVDEAANDRNDAIISTEKSAVEIHVIPTQENLVIARHVFNLLRQTQPPPFRAAM